MPTEKIETTEMSQCQHNKYVHQDLFQKKALTSLTTCLACHVCCTQSRTKTHAHTYTISVVKERTQICGGASLTHEDELREKEELTPAINKTRGIERMPVGK